MRYSSREAALKFWFGQEFRRRISLNSESEISLFM